LSTVTTTAACAAATLAIRAAQIKRTNRGIGTPVSLTVNHRQAKRMRGGVELKLY
jgi:hypothetical protein